MSSLESKYRKDGRRCEFCRYSAQNENSREPTLDLICQHGPPHAIRYNDSCTYFKASGGVFGWLKALLGPGG